jgi:hypothetical protein
VAEPCTFEKVAFSSNPPRRSAASRRKHEHAPESLDSSLSGRVRHPALRLLAGLARAVRGLRQRARALSWRTTRDTHEDVRHVACLARQEERGCVARARWRPVPAAFWATFGDGTLPCVVWVVGRRHEATGPRSLYHETALEPLSLVCNTQKVFT